MSRYASAAGIIGADAAARERAVVIRVLNVQDVVKKEGGDLASLARRFLPDAVDTRFYDELVKQLQDEFKKQGVVASVNVVDAGVAPTARVPESTAVRDVAIGVGTGIFTGVVVQWLFSLWRRRA